MEFKNLFSILKLDNGKIDVFGDWNRRNILINTDNLPENTICELGLVGLSTYKEVVEKVNNCMWGPLNEGCYCITSYIDQNNPYYPVLKVYTYDQHSFIKIKYIEIYIMGKKVTYTDYYGYISKYMSYERIICTKENGYCDNRFDKVDEIYEFTNVMNSYELVSKYYAKDDCRMGLHVKADVIDPNPAEIELHKIQDALLFTSVSKKEEE